MLLSFVKFQVKPINFDGWVNVQPLFLDVWISQSNVAGQFSDMQYPVTFR